VLKSAKNSRTASARKRASSNTHCAPASHAFGDSRRYFRNIPRFPCERLKLAKTCAQVNNKVPNLFLLFEYFLIELKLTELTRRESPLIFSRRSKAGEEQRFKKLFLPRFLITARITRFSGDPQGDAGQVVRQVCRSRFGVWAGGSKI